jgi:hypothetical protein
MNSATEAFTPNACYPLALESLGVKTIPSNAEDATTLLAAMLASVETPNLHYLAHDVTQKIVTNNIRLNFDEVYGDVTAFFRDLQQRRG